MTEPDRIWINDKWEAYLRPTFAGDTSGYVCADIAALPARGVGVPEGWHMERLSRGNGFLFYTLRQDGWRKGEPIMVNDVTIRLEPTPGSDTDLEPIASAILAALAPTDAAQAREAALREAAKIADEIAATSEDDRYWGVDARRQGEQAAAKNIAMNILALIGEART